MLDFAFTPAPTGVLVLSRAPKTRRPVNFRRRSFLIRCCQGASAALIPSSLRGLAFPSAGPLGSAGLELVADYRLHPHYRAQMPADALLLKTQAGLDAFITEKYEDQIAAVLARWTSGLKKSPQDLKAIKSAFAPNFRASSLQPSETRALRSGPALEIARCRFAGSPTLAQEEFAREFRSALAALSKVITAEFEVTGIEVKDVASTASGAPLRLETRVRYDLVGEGEDFYREERVGHWQLDWETNSAGELRLLKWQPVEETRSRAREPVFVDITSQALGSNPSYAAQLVPGVDYWRSVLDGACGIDIYGHNGVSVGDIDNDGFDDLYVCQPAGLPNRLYRNRGDGTFEDITEAAGVGVLENTPCAIFADLDNDGCEDLIVVSTTGPMLFLNEGNSKFRQKPDAFQFAKPPQGTFTGAAVADYDRDGWLDIYVCLYLYYQGAEQYQYPSPYYDAENGPPNFLLRNNRDGTFRDVTAATGLDQNNTRYSFCCGWSDFNRDGWPDLYVVNDFGRKNLYRNNGDGTFTDIAPQAGVEDVGAGMSVCWFDYDNDGAEDLYVANMWSSAGKRVTMQEAFMKQAPEEVRALYRKHANGNSLFRNTGKGRFQDQSSSAGAEMGRWSWSSDAWDFDHDGYLDLYITSGMVSGTPGQDLNSFFWRQVVPHSPQEAKPSHAYEQGWNAINELIRADGTWNGFERNVFYANNRDGTFSDVSGAVGLDFLEDGRAFAVADFDRDGRLEVFLKNRNGPQIRILRNVVKELPPSIAFRLRGVQSNRDAIGAAVTVETGNGRQTRLLQAESGFLSQHTKDVFFGLGESRSPVRASIRWPSGLIQELRDLPPGHRIWVEEGSEPSRIEPFQRQPAPQERPPAPVPQVAAPLPATIETWLLAPVAAPDFLLSDLNGGTQSLASLRGRPVLLQFWSTESRTCEADLYLLSRVHTRWAAQGLQLVSVNVNHPDDAATVRTFARRHSLSFRVLLASEDVAAIYNILYRYLFDRHRDLGLPTSFLIADKGEIVKVYQGPLDAQNVQDDFRHIPQTAAERLARGLPFPGLTDVTAFRRDYLTYGVVYFHREYFEQAEAMLQLALQNDPRSAEACYGLGSVYMKRQKPDEARNLFQRALKLLPASLDTWPNSLNNLGVVAAQQGRYDEAIQYFTEAIHRSPNFAFALKNLGNAYRQQGRWEKAREALDRALETEPDDPEANYSLGMVYAQQDDAGHAAEYLLKALKLRPDYPEALNNLGVLYILHGRPSEARANFERSIQVAPDFDQPYINLARLYVAQGEREKAREILRRLLERHPDHALAQKALSQISP